MPNYTMTPAPLGSVLARGWELSRRTLPTSGLLFLVIIVPMTVLTGFVAKTLMLGIMELVRTQGAGTMDEQAVEQMMGQMMVPLLGSYMAIIMLSLLYQFLLPYATTASIIAGWSAVNDDEDLTLGDILRRAIRRPFWYILAQGILVGVIIGVANFISSMLGLLLGLATAGIGAFVVQIAFMGALVYYIIATIFSKHEIVVNDRGPMKSLLASIELVKGSWGRIFGLMALVTAAVAICYLPIGIPILLDVIKAFGVISSNPDDTALMAGELLSAFSLAFSPLTLIYVGLVTAASMHLFTNITTVLYADLSGSRAIAGEDEWGEDGDEAPAL